MKYPDGSNVQIGDKVWVNEGSDIAIVAEVLESKEKISSWGVGEPGIMVCFDLKKRDYSCDAFIALSQFNDEGIGKTEEASC